MIPETATGLEIVRIIIAVVGLILATIAEVVIIRDYQRLRADGADGADGASGIVYAQTIFSGAVNMAIQGAYCIVGILAADAPQTVIPQVTAYTAVAVWVSIISSALLMATSVWKLASRQALAALLLREATLLAEVRAIRDAERDAERDPGRDRERDMRRDIGRDPPRDGMRDVMHDNASGEVKP